MLKTNSKQVKENIKKYILEGFNPLDYEGLEYLEGTKDYKEACTAIFKVFKREKPSIGNYVRMTEKERFFDWCQGGASILYTGYYYFPNAKNDLGEILKETEAEKKKYSEDEACYLLTSLLYREIKENMEV